MTASPTRRRLATTAIVGGVVLSGVAIGLAGSTADAHHTTVSCVDQATSTWSIVNSERDRSMTFTSPQGPAGLIAGGGSVTVVYVGDRLQIDGVWVNGQQASNVGVGDCTPETTTTTSTTVPAATTTTTVPVTTTTTTVPVTTTVPPAASTVPTATTLPPYVGHTCLLYTPGSRADYSDAFIAEGEWVGASQADAEGTTFVSGQWCKRIPAAVSADPPTATELPATGPWTTGALLAGAVALTVLGLSLCRAAKRGDELEVAA